MSLVFNEAALKFLLESPAGPVGRKLLLASERISHNYNVQIQTVWENQSAINLPVASFNIGSGDDGLQSEIGIVDGGRISQYMAQKFAEKERDKFVPKIMADWDSNI